FPQLIAGPIVHHAEMMPQFASRWNLVKKYKNIALGLFIFSIGLFKKVVLADSFSIWATAGFDHTIALSFLDAWSTSLSYTFQLYFDFSGYTDMAIGAALLFNIKLPINFNSPYKALDIQDFWRRWHITLSRFLKDYIYIPLGGNRKGLFRTYSNLLATFILGGIWHGAGWTFVFWGFLHGIALVIHRFWKSLGFQMPKTLAWFITFNFINIAWVFFRAREWDDAIKVLNGMININDIYFSKKYAHIVNQANPISEYIKLNDFNYTFWVISLGFIIILYLKNSNQFHSQFNTMKTIPITWTLFIIFILGISLITTVSNTGSEFLYFNF
ncbi:MAG: MBOAT family protein, partial [Bacteroidales bacterium]|nr:MBOAT family protein [Bacteroidales bacterium]